MTDTTRPDELEQYAHLLEEAKAIHGVSLWTDAWRRLRRNWQAMGSLYVLILLVVIAMLAPLLPLQPPRTIHTGGAASVDGRSLQFQPPTLEKAPPLTPPKSDNAPETTDEQRRAAALEEGFGDLDYVSNKLLHARAAIFGEWSIPSLCGRDKLGRDLLSRIIWGARISCAVGLIATLVSLVIGVSYGAVSGYFGGWVDNLMMRMVDVLYSVPFIFVVIFVITIVNAPGVLDGVEEWINGWLALVGLGGFEIDRLFVFFVLVGAIYWLTMARVVRGQVISLKNEQFVEAARTLGAGRFRIIFLHLVPNLLSVVIVYLTLTIPRVILFEAFLSFLGLGVEPPDVSWGLLANEGLQVITPVRTYSWLVLFPSLALGVTLFALNFLGDGLRDALDPRMKNR